MFAYISIDAALHLCSILDISLHQTYLTKPANVPEESMTQALHPRLRYLSVSLWIFDEYLAEIGDPMCL